MGCSTRDTLPCNLFMMTLFTGDPFYLIASDWVQGEFDGPSFAKCGQEWNSNSCFVQNVHVDCSTG